MLLNLNGMSTLQREQLARVRKATAREDFENRNAGRFRRIFPSEDKLKQQKYVNIMSSIFGIVMSGRAPAMQKEIQKVYNNQFRVRTSIVMQMCKYVFILGERIVLNFGF